MTKYAFGFWLTLSRSHGPNDVSRKAKSFIFEEELQRQTTFFFGIMCTDESFTLRVLLHVIRK